MEKKDKTDYAAAYRQYCTYGRGRSIKQFCEEDFNYTKFRRYVDKALWSASKSERDSFGSQFTPLVVDGAPADTTPAVTPTEIVVDSSPTSIHISSIDVKLSNGLRLTVDSPSLDSLIDVLRKLLVDMVSIRANRIITCTPAIWKAKSSDELRNLLPCYCKL